MGHYYAGCPLPIALALCDAAEHSLWCHSGATDIWVRPPGMTDSAIARRMLLAARVAPDGVGDVVCQPSSAAAADAYERHVPDDLRPYLTPHADDIARHGYVAIKLLLGLVTGNIERIAWRKLAAAHLNGYFSIGAFGDEAEAREELPPRAILLAEQAYGRRFPPITKSILSAIHQPISPAAPLHTLRTIAVATGPEHSLAELSACPPDLSYSPT